LDADETIICRANRIKNLKTYLYQIKHQIKENVYKDVVLMDINEKVYFPDHSIQGEDIPLSITWDKGKTIKINIFFSKNLYIKEIYNVDHSGINIEDNSIYVTKFESNGYLGLALQTKSDSDSMVDEEIIIRISQDKDEKIIKKTIKLFRPDIKLVFMPREINIIKNGTEFDIQNKIIIRNCGNGTALLKLREMDSSELRTVDLGGLGEFINKVLGEFMERLEQLKYKYPYHSELIDEFKKTRVEDSQLDKADIIKNIALKITSTFETDRDFMDDFMSALFISYVGNINVIIPFEEFIRYIKSINIGRIILSNPISAIKATTSDQILNAELTLTDLAYNTYDPIELKNIKISSNIECDVPIYLLFKFENGSEEY